MEQLVCKECGKTFEYNKIGSCRCALNHHLKKEHGMSIEEYIVKHEYGGVHPKCPCGCGHELKLSQSKNGWKFNTYYADTCYGSIVRRKNKEIDEMVKSTDTKNEFDIVKYYEEHYDRKTYEEAFNLLKSKTFTLADVSKTYNIDKRTLKKVWIALKITDTQELTELLEYNKYIMPSQSRMNTSVNDDDVMTWCHKLIKTYPCKYTTHSLSREYNNAHPDKRTPHSGEIIARGLYKMYGDEINLYLAEGLHSSEEYRFYEVLRFYMKDYVVKLGKKFILKDGYIYYDIIIGSKLLIEYDSDGYFHKEERIKEKDLNKENFALENGYAFLRLNKDDIFDINTIARIKNILENEVN